MTSAERKAAEASAPPVQTGYFDPNNPGVQLPPQFHDMPILKLQLHILFTFENCHLENVHFLNLLNRPGLCSTPCLLQRPTPGLRRHREQEK